MNHTRLFIISGASGTGKTSLVRELLQNDQKMELSISCTTREPMQGERDGHDYHFVKEQQFHDMQQQGQFLEYAQIYNNHYGTNKQTVLGTLQKGKDVLLEIDWQGARQVCQNFPQAITVFILPPDIDTLRNRLEARGRDSKDAIQHRLNNAIKEIQQAKNYQHLIINQQLHKASQELQQIIQAYRNNQQPDSNKNREHWQQLLQDYQA